MEIVFIFVAFIFGLAIKMAGFPPLIGFLIAGFTLNYLGYEASANLETLANLGITLMLFTIGLKLNVRDLYKKEVWLGSILHTVIWITLVNVVLTTLLWFGLSVFTQLSLLNATLLAFALSFSSTVCIIKILEESGEIKTRHGKVAVGILVMQDIFAVLFMVFATGKIPSLWALLLPLLFFVRPFINTILERVGHGELLPLTGFMLAIGGYQLFSLVGIKGDLGALVIGMLLAKYSKAAELSKSLMSFKDIFLIAFFLTIGFTALPTFELVTASLLLCVLIPIKFVLFFKIFTWLKLRARTAYLASLVLSNYSEFGLIVIALMVSLGVMDTSWLVILAMALSFSFVFTGIVYRNSHNQYNTYKNMLKRYENPIPLTEDTYVQPKNAEILVLGMGRVGKGAYASLNAISGDNVWGMDADPARIAKLQKQGLQVLVGDGEDIDLWENMELSKIQLILLALPSIKDICNITEQLQHANYKGKIASIARYEDEIQPLLDAGSDKVFNFFTEAGTGFAEESLQLLEPARTNFS
ncbi:cation:proton antiporter family protein [Paraglaciecola hydrolytica]|uniref:Potassium transporter Kef n=1 Tax=Paraglaciecola hydrolytica TaxID=1799789 RepID=A0A136A1M5_9ALTE|nr:cation:proton antiporter family protein [Paraglaciecola hydrolytica]KXI29103.1 potassium transporter Kef [Paraglaciecola hydrolytica]